MAEDRLDRIEAILEGLAKRDESLSRELDQTKQQQAKRDAVFDKRIAALIARDEALQARHEALAESVEMMVQSWFRKGGPDKQAGA
jgi:hypothetical protein